MQLLLLLLLLTTAYFLIRGFLSGSADIWAKYRKNLLLGVVVLAVLYLTATGRLNLLLGAIGVAVAYLFRVLPILLNHAPHLQRLWQMFSAAPDSGPQPRGNQNPGKMSVDEAYQVLGLQPDVTEQEIIAAHRKLMQKNHPDHGGSDYLASKINLAKKTLLNK